MPKGYELDRETIVPLVCERLSKGIALSVICREIGISRRTFNSWRESDPAIDALAQDAKDDGYDALAQQCLEIADTPCEGEEIEYDAAGLLIKRKVGDMLGHRKTQIETRLKLLAKWDPKRYGDRLHQTVTGANDAPLLGVILVPHKQITDHDDDDPLAAQPEAV